jgi:hypothetical protein
MEVYNSRSNIVIVVVIVIEAYCYNKERHIVIIKICRRDRGI